MSCNKLFSFSPSSCLFCVCVCLSVSQSVSPSVRPSVSLSVCSPVCTPVCLCVCYLSILCVCLFNRVSVIPPVYQLYLPSQDTYFSKFVLTGETYSNCISWCDKHLLCHQGCSGFWVFGLQDYWSFIGVTQYVRFCCCK